MDSIFVELLRTRNLELRLFVTQVAILVWADA